MRGSIRTRLLIFIGLSIALILVPPFLKHTQNSENANIRQETEALLRALDFRLDVLRGHLATYQLSLADIGETTRPEVLLPAVAQATNTFLTATRQDLSVFSALIQRQHRLTKTFDEASSSAIITYNTRLQNTYRQLGPVADASLESMGETGLQRESIQTLSQLLIAYRTSLYEVRQASKRDITRFRENLDESTWSVRVLELGLFIAWLGALGLLINVFRAFNELDDERYLPSLGHRPLPSEFQPIQSHLQKLNQRQSELTRRIESLEGELQRSQVVSRRSENDLSLERLFVRNLLDNLRAAVFVTDVLGRVEFANRRAKRIGDPGEPTESLVLWNALEQTLGSAREILNEISQTRKSFHSSALRLVASEREYVFEVSVSPHTSPTGDILQFIWLLDDITEEVAAKNQLLQSEHLAAMGRISTQVAHEIRNPLSAINLNAELIQAELSDLSRDPSETAKMRHAQDSISAMIREIERLEKVTESYLQLSKMPSPTTRATDLVPILNDLIQMFGPEWQSQNLLSKLECSEPTLNVMLDEGLFRQAMINVLRNAAEAMPLGGNLYIRAMTQGMLVQVEVVDEGSGCSEEDIKRAFEPFFTTKAQGTGLGLHLTRQIVEEHGGKLAFERNPHVGMTMQMTFPAA